MKLSHSCTICPLQVLSELLSDLEACDLQKGDTKVLANGEVAPGKFIRIFMDEIRRVVSLTTV